MTDAVFAMTVVLNSMQKDKTLFKNHTFCKTRGIELQYKNTKGIHYYLLLSHETHSETMSYSGTWITNGKHTLSSY